jgi:hypothetical protein
LLLQIWRRSADARAAPAFQVRRPVFLVEWRLFAVGQVADAARLLTGGAS